MYKGKKTKKKYQRIRSGLDSYAKLSIKTKLYVDFTKLFAKNATSSANVVSEFTF